MSFPGTISHLESKGLSDKIIMRPYTTSNICYPKLVWDNSGIKLKFKWSCLKQDKATFTSKNEGNLFLVRELDTWSRDLSTEFALKNCFFRSTRVTKMLIQINAHLAATLKISIRVHYFHFQVLIKVKLSLYLE